MDRPLHDPTALTKRKQVFKAISDLKQALRVGRYAIEDEPILNGDLLSSLEELVSPVSSSLDNVPNWFMCCSSMCLFNEANYWYCSHVAVVSSRCAALA